MNPRSILIPVIGFTASGGNRVLCRFASEWVRCGLRVSFLVLDGSTSPTFDTSAEVIHCSTLDPAWVPARRWGKLSQPMNIWRLARALRHLKNDFDVILANHAFTALACSAAGASSQALYYVQAYDPEVLLKKNTLSSRVAAMLATMSYGLCRKQVVNSPHYLAYPKLRATHVVPPGVDIQAFMPKSVPGGMGSPVRIGIIGRSEPHKYRPVLDAYRLIAERHADCRLVVAYGNVPSEELARCDSYEIVRPTNDGELASFYRSCDVFLALTEFPQGAFYPPLEALASGTALISNPFLLVNDANSWVVNTPEQAAEAYDALHASPEKRHAKSLQGIADVQARLDWHTLATELAAIMQDLIPTRPESVTINSARPS